MAFVTIRIESADGRVATRELQIREDLLTAPASPQNDNSQDQTLSKVSRHFFNAYAELFSRHKLIEPLRTALKVVRS